MRILTKDQIHKLSDKNLLNYHRVVRSAYYNTRLAEDEEFETSLHKIYSDLRDLVKKELDTRSHVARKGTPNGVNINFKTRNRK